MFERQPFYNHKLTGIWNTSFILLGCLSLFLINSAYAQVANPSTGDTIKAYCSSGTCHSPGGTSSNITPASNTSPLLLPALKQNLIGIQLSGTCLTYAKNHINSTCLSYKDLVKFDNTNRHLAGDFTDKPYFHRLPPLIKNFFVFTDKSMVAVDPNNDFTLQAKMIIINPKNFTWIDKSEDAINGGQIAKYHVDRRMLGCEQSQVASNLNLINDTINYLSSGCTTTNFNDTRIITQKAIPFSYDNQYSTLHHDDYLAAIFHNHKFFNSYKPVGGLGPSNCQTGQCSFTDPYAKIGYK